jgi:hypothetical protein
MKTTLIFALLLSSGLGACKTQSYKRIEELVYISQSEPFQISEGEKTTLLPAYLKPLNFKEGIIIIDYFLDDNGLIEGINLGVLRLTNTSDESIVTFRNKHLNPIQNKHYPKKIRKYLKWVYDYSKTRKVVQAGSIQPSTKWKISVLVRLK